MSKPSHAVWVTVKQIWYDYGLAHGREEKGCVVATLECGHWQIYKRSRSPGTYRKVACARCTAADMSRRSSVHKANSPRRRELVLAPRVCPRGGSASRRP